MTESGPSDRFLALAVGQSATMTRTVSESEIVLFAAITGDSNPVHLDDAQAQASRFKGRIAHGMLTAGFVSATMAMQLPGPGSIYLSQSLRFLRPVRIGDAITTTVEIIELLPDQRHARLSTECRNQSGKLVLDGEAVILIPREG
ncbi:MAG: MaoC family dehydratase [Gemmatimonadaceae bacterium]|nr:MaoC family dehydratase [Gemmatimonadaceae bacterium]